MIRVCFVCLGNICRSPTAEGVMAHLVRAAGLEHAVEVASAGTAGYHIGERPDERARTTAQRRGVALPSRAAQFRAADFQRFDYVVAMDHANRDDLLRLARSANDRNRVHLLRRFDPDSSADAEVPDPYYGGPQGFEEVFEICTAACRGLLEHLQREHSL